MQVPEVSPQALSSLFAGLDARLPDADPQVGGVTMDSRRVAPADLYVGLPGSNHHGARFAGQAREAGAVALLTDPEGAEQARDAGLPTVVANDVRAVMAEVSARSHGRPAERMTSFGVTGTNGKSTTVLMLAEALASAGRVVGSIGTLGFLVGGEALDLARTTVTTPEAPDLQAILAMMAAKGADTMAMEVSSHALALDRVSGIRFDVVGFTNLGRDHLDFHETMDDYFHAKSRLFTSAFARRAVINTDDPAGRRLVALAGADGLPVATVGFGEDCDYRISQWRPTRMGAEFVLSHAGTELAAEIALPGDYNVRNAATALAMIDQAGLDMAAALPGLARAVIPGRMQPVPLPGAAPRVYVDFAHTPQAVASALSALSNPDAPEGARTIVVIGAGGDRDPDKRGPMGAAAASAADVVVVTDDNPRSEDPAQIRAAVLAGAREVTAAAAEGTRASRVVLIDGGDRGSAIECALRLARPDDAVAVLGKGHERTQQLADRVVEFDDVVVVTDTWREITVTAGGTR